MVLLGEVVWKFALEAWKAEDFEQKRALGHEARGLMRRAVELEPNNARARMRFGNVLQGLGDKREAEREYRAALELWPNDSAPHWLLGGFLSSTDQDHAQAGQLLKRAVELDPDDSTAHFYLGKHYLGKHYLRLKRKFKARQELQTSARLGNAGAQRLLEKLGLSAPHDAEALT